LEETELFVVYAVLVLLSAAAGIAREAVFAVRGAHRAGNARAYREAGRIRPLLERSDEYLLTILIVTHLTKLGSVCVLFGLFHMAGLALVSGPATSHATGVNIVFQLALALVIGFGVVVLVAELVPRHVARARPEVWLRRLAPLVRALHVVFYPVGWVAGRLVRLLKRAFGIKGSIFPLPEAPHALLELIEASEENGKLEEDDRELITSIFEFRDTIVREVMVPRVDMVCVDDEATLVEAHRLFVEGGHSRMPVYHDDLDHIVGVLYAKDLLAYVEKGPLDERKVHDVLHEPMFVPETKRVAELLREFQRERLHIAIVVDEYGGTSGLVTIEDLLEEIVGEIRDEFDTEPPLYEPDGRGGFIVDAKMPIYEIEDDLGIALPEEEEYDTLGGYLFTRLGKVPEVGEVLTENGVEITVLEADERRIYRVRLKPMPAGDASSAGPKG
jgi:putative hemolysin